MPENLKGTRRAETPGARMLGQVEPLQAQALQPNSVEFESAGPLRGHFVSSISLATSMARGLDLQEESFGRFSLEGEFIIASYSFGTFRTLAGKRFPELIGTRAPVILTSQDREAFVTILAAATGVPSMNSIGAMAFAPMPASFIESLLDPCSMIPKDAAAELRYFCDCILGLMKKGYDPVAGYGCAAGGVAAITRVISLFGGDASWCSDSVKLDCWNDCVRERLKKHFRNTECWDDWLVPEIYCIIEDHLKAWKSCCRRC